MIATCHTKGCVNEGRPIDVAFSSVVVCGPCGNEATLTEKTPPKTAPKRYAEPA